MKGTAEEVYTFGVDYIFDMVKKLRGYGVMEVHLFILNDSELGKEIIGKIK